MDDNRNVLKISPPAWMLGVGTVVALFFIAFLATVTRNAWRQHAFIGRVSQTPHTIMISGEGKVTALPDIAVIALGTQIERRTVAAAQQENTAAMNKLRERLKTLAIPSADITTSQYTVYPQYDYAAGRQTLRAYQVTQQLTVKIRDFEKISAVLATVGELNLNQVGGLSFTVDDPERFRQAARLKALAQAKQKAQALAAGADVRLGRIVTFAEEAAGGLPPVYARAAYGLGGDAALAPIVEPGSQDIVVVVTVGYELE